MLYWLLEELKADINFLFLTRASLNNKPSSGFAFSEIDTQKLFRQQTFKKAECLKSRNAIKLLFSKGRSVSQHPLKALWLPLELSNGFPAQVCITAPKKKFPKAWQRNRIKRLIREAYRMHKPLLYEYLISKQTQMALVFIFTGKEMPDYELISDKMVNIIELVQKDHALSTSDPR